MLTRKLVHLVKSVQRTRMVALRWKSERQKGPEGVALPPEPTYCCQSGCPNCVWIKYAQEVAQMFDNGDVIAKNKIMEKVQDPKLRAYLFTQLGLKEKD